VDAWCNLTTENRPRKLCAALGTKAKRLHDKEGFSWTHIYQAVLLMDEKGYGVASLESFLDNVVTTNSAARNGRSNHQTSFVGPNARFEDKKYETLEEYLAKKNSAL
jgi:hypothetical protein